MSFNNIISKGDNLEIRKEQQVEFDDKIYVVDSIDLKALRDFYWDTHTIEGELTNENNFKVYAHKKQHIRLEVLENKFYFCPFKPRFGIIYIANLFDNLGNMPIDIKLNEFLIKYPTLDRDKIRIVVPSYYFKEVTYTDFIVSDMKVKYGDISYHSIPLTSLAKTGKLYLSLLGTSFNDLIVLQEKDGFIFFRG